MCAPQRLARERRGERERRGVMHGSGAALARRYSLATLRCAAHYVGAPLTLVRRAVRERRGVSPPVPTGDLTVRRS